VPNRRGKKRTLKQKMGKRDFPALATRAPCKKEQLKGKKALSGSLMWCREKKKNVWGENPFPRPNKRSRQKDRRRSKDVVVRIYIQRITRREGESRSIVRIKNLTTGKLKRRRINWGGFREKIVPCVPGEDKKGGKEVLHGLQLNRLQTVSRQGGSKSRS